MKQKLELGSAPYDEDEVAQVGTPGYEELAARECRAFINQLWRMLHANFGLNRDNNTYLFTLIRTSHNHEFGTYYEVGIKYEENDKHAVEIALWLEDNLPTNWDVQAREELKNRSV